MCTIGRICNRCMGCVAVTTQREREMSAIALYSLNVLLKWSIQKDGGCTADADAASTTENLTMLSVSDGSERLIWRLSCGWLGVVWAWSTHATVSSGRGWLGVIVAWQADLSGRLGATGRCASTGGVLVITNDCKEAWRAFAATAELLFRLMRS